MVAEIVGQDGWQPGNNVVVFLDYTAEGGHYIDWTAYDADRYDAALLQVSYSVEPAPAPRTFSSFRTNTPPTIDANLSDWSALTGVVLRPSSASFVSGQINSAADASATCWSEWDALSVYVGCLATDDRIFADSGPDWWQDDTLEIVFDGLNDHLSFYFDDHKFEFQVDNQITDYGGALHPAVQAAFRGTYAGYVVELAVPRAVLGLDSLNEGQILGFNLGQIDDDNGGLSEGWMVWNGTTTYRHADEYGHLLLEPGDATPTPTATATPTPRQPPHRHPRARPL